MLEVCDLAVSYRNCRAINNISFCLQPGTISGLFGPNGAGKSTLLKGILGLVPILHGNIRYNSLPLKRSLKKVAYIPQRNQIDWDYPVLVEKVVMMGRIPAIGWFREPNQNSKRIVANALAKVGMSDFARYPIGELSGGQQQRVFLARAIAQKADLFFFDEPFNNVDCQTEDIIFEVFQELKQQQKTLLVISHDLSETITNYDHLLLLNQQLIASGNRHDVLTTRNIQQTYGRPLVNSYS